MEIVQRPFCWKSWDISFALRNQLQDTGAQKSSEGCCRIVAGGAQADIERPSLTVFVPIGVLPRCG